MGGWDPFSDGFRVLERLGGRFREGWPSEGLLLPEPPAAHEPAADLFEDAEGLVYEVELPGVRAADLMVTLDAGVLCVEAERQFARAAGGCVHAIEGRYGRMRREFVLPVRSVPEQAVAELVRGVLRVRVPRLPEAATTTRRLETREEPAVRVPMDAPLS